MQRKRYSFVIINEGIKYVLVLFIAFLLLLIFSFYACAFVLACLLALVFMLYYNPERIPFEEGENLIYSPVDGVVRAIERDKDGGVLLTLYAPLYSVGVIRLPFGGKATLRHTKGIVFGNYCEESLRLGEHATLDVDSVYGCVVCRFYPLIFPKGLRFFSCPLSQKGQRMGFILTGVVQLQIDSSVRLKVCEGDRVKGGETTIGVFA